MNTGFTSESQKEIIETQKAWLRDSACAVYAEADAKEVHQYLNQLWEAEQADVQLKMLVRCCCENLEKQYPGQFSFAFLEAAKRQPANNSGLKQPLNQERVGSEVNSDACQKTEIQCAACGFLLSSDANFCPKCGENLRVAQNTFASRCAHCNSTLKNSEVYCPKCGELANYKPAGIVKRACAIFLDLIALGFFMPICMYAVMWLTFLLALSGLPLGLFISGNRNFIYSALISGGLVFFLSGLYYLILEKGLKIGSLGKKLLGLRMVSCGKQPVTIKKVFLRHTGRWLELLAVFAGPVFVGMWSWGYDGRNILYPHEIGFILTAVDLVFLVIIVSRLIREKSFFHDSISNTMVIET